MKEKLQKEVDSLVTQYITTEETYFYDPGELVGNPGDYNLSFFQKLKLLFS